MRSLYLDLYNGLSWEMLLGSLLSLMKNKEAFLNEFEKAGFGYDYGLAVSEVYQNGQNCCRMELVAKRPVGKHAVSKSDIDKVISISGISEQAKITARRMLREIHCDSVTAVHPAALAIALDMLKIDIIQYSPLNIGRHRLAPGELKYLSGITVYQDASSDVPLDIRTAEMLRAVAYEKSSLPAMRLVAIGYGYGEKGRPLKAYLMDSLEYAYYEQSTALQINITGIFECKCDNWRK